MLLVISTKLQKAIDICNKFDRRGLLAYPVRPHDALREVSTKYRAVIIEEPERIIDLPAYIKELRTYVTPLTIFAHSTNVLPKNVAKLFDHVLGVNLTVYRSYISFIIYQTKHNFPLLAEYRLAGMTVYPGPEPVHFFEYDFYLERRFKMVLCFLIRMYPNPVKIRTIVKYVFPPKTEMQDVSIRAIISKINRTFRELFGRNLIYNIKNEGYVVLTPELIAERNLPVPMHPVFP